MPRFIDGNNMEPMITITKDEYEQLKADSNFLICLQNAGVDNWEGYEFAQDDFNEGEEA